MEIGQFLDVYDAVMLAGYEKEVDWSENLLPCESSEQFLQEYIWVVLNSGMKNQVAIMIYERIKTAIKNGQPIESVFRHKGKVRAILDMILTYKVSFRCYQKAENKLEYLEKLSYIGKITKYHLAKNLGFDICKPDRHLMRIATKYKTTPQELCKKLSNETGFRIATIDVVLWRAANLGII